MLWSLGKCEENAGERDSCGEKNLKETVYVYPSCFPILISSQTQGPQRVETELAGYKRSLSDSRGHKDSFILRPFTISPHNAWTAKGPCRGQGAPRISCILISLVNVKRSSRYQEPRQGRSGNTCSMRVSCELRRWTWSCSPGAIACQPRCS